MVIPPSTRAKAPKRRRSLTALKQTPLANPVSRPQGMTGVEETPQDTTAPTDTGTNTVETIVVDPPTPTTEQPVSSAAAAASAQSAPASTTTTTAKPGLDQSGAGQKASSAHRGTKRRLAMPAWRLGDSFFRDAAFESYTRPPPQVNHKHVVFASLKDVDPLPDMHDIVLAAYHQFEYRVVAIDVFTASMQVALAFTTAAHADDAAKDGLILDNDFVIPCTRRPNYRPIVETVHVYGTDCTNPDHTSDALAHYFGHYGKVIDIAPRYWEDTPILTGTWQVMLDRNAPVKDKITTVPPEVGRIGGVDVFLDIPGVRRVCRVCKTTEHTNPACRIGQSLAQQGKQQQQQDQQQQQKQKQQQKQFGTRRWADLLKQPSSDRVPPPMPTPKKAGKGKGKDKAADDTGNKPKDTDTNTTTTSKPTATGDKDATGKDGTGTGQHDPPAHQSPRISPATSRQSSPSRRAMDTEDTSSAGRTREPGTEWAEGSSTYPHHDPIRDPANIANSGRPYRYDLDLSARERGDDSGRRSRSPSRTPIATLRKGFQPSPDVVDP